MNHKPYVGIWLDHRKSLLFWMNSSAETDMETIESGYQEEGEPTDSIEGALVGGGAVPHAHVENRRREQLKRYHKKLVKALRHAGRIYLFGPGQAKKELAGVLENDKTLRAQLCGVEGADKNMTIPQMVARVREKFELPASDPW